MKTDQFDVALALAEKALNNLDEANTKAVEAAIAERVGEIEKGRWWLDLLGRKEGVFVAFLCEELTEPIEVGYLQALMDFDMDHIGDGDVAYGEQLLADLQKLVERTQKALIEARKHPYE